jgi:hypothetical protein
MQQSSNNPLEDNDYPQAERDRVMEKFQTLKDLIAKTYSTSTIKSSIRNS